MSPPDELPLLELIFAIAPLALILTLILGALWRSRNPRRITHIAARTAAATLIPLTLASYLIPINLTLWAIAMLLGLGAALTAAFTAPRRLLLIEPLALPIFLMGIALVVLWI